MQLSFGPFLTCFVAIAFLTAYFYYLIYIKKMMFIQTRLFVLVILLILIRMIVPLNFPFTYSIYSTKVIPMLTGFLYYPIRNSNFLVLYLFYIVWFAGSVFLVGRFLSQNIRLHKFLKNYYIDKDSEQAKRLKALLGNELDKIQIAVVPNNEVPSILFGRRPTLILPNIEKYTDAELEQICKHELNHYKKHDLILIASMNIVCCVQWWNPLVYLLKHEFKLLLELSNDYQLISLEPDFNRVKYAELILKVAKSNQERSCVFPLGMESTTNFVGKSKSNLRTRIHFILNNHSDEKEKPHEKFHVLVILTVFILTFFIVAEPLYPIKEEHIEDSVSITPKNSYIIQKNNEFDIFVNDEYFITVTTIPEELHEIPIRTLED